MKVILGHAFIATEAKFAIVLKYIIITYYITKMFQSLEDSLD